MMVSTKGRYALRVMLDLAGQDEEQYISLNDIAGRQQISMKYLEAIVALLNKAGLLKSRRGKDGGRLPRWHVWKRTHAARSAGFRQAA